MTSESTPGGGSVDPTAPVEAVLFDLDETLCDYRRSGSELIALACDRVGVEQFFEVEEYYERYSEFVDDSDGIDDLRERAFAALAGERGHDPDVGRDVARVYADERDHENVDPLPGAIEAVETLSESYPVGVVTNGAPEMQRQKLSAIGLADAFETIVYAGHEVPGKPEPDPFERALDALGTDPGRAVHIGNSLESDVTGAHAAGLRSVLVTHVADLGDTVDPTPHHRVETPGDLVDPPWE